MGRNSIFPIVLVLPGLKSQCCKSFWYTAVCQYSSTHVYWYGEYASSGTSKKQGHIRDHIQSHDPTTSRRESRVVQSITTTNGALQVPVDRTGHYRLIQSRLLAVIRAWWLLGDLDS
jgi:hypothetical protein